MSDGKKEARRIALSVFGGVVVAIVLAAGIALLMGWFTYWMSVPFWRLLLQVVSYELPITATATLVGVLIYRILSREAPDTQCRCRRCGYILKGVSKLECPECGEVI